MKKTLDIIIKEIREEIAQQIESVDVGGSAQLNGLGMKIIAAKIARGSVNEGITSSVEYKI